jgi:hypothetical protein
MSGSLTYRAYTSDTGAVYSVKLDESNSEGRVVGGAANDLVPIRTTNAPALPSGVKKRYVNTFNSALPAQRRRFYVGNLAAFAQATAPGAQITTNEFSGAGNTTSTTVTWNVSSFSGEKSRVVPAFGATDTGLTDGDVTQ